MKGYGNQNFLLITGTIMKVSYAVIVKIIGEMENVKHCHCGIATVVKNV